MKLTNAIYVSSWRRYNEQGGLSGKWYNVEDFNDFDDLQEQLTSDGFDLEGYDEELTILDFNLFDSYLSVVLDTDSNDVQNMFETIQAFEELTDDEQQEIAVVVKNELRPASTANDIHNLVKASESYIFHHGLKDYEIAENWILENYSSEMMRDIDFNHFDLDYIIDKELSLNEELGLLFETF